MKASFLLGLVLLRLSGEDQGYVCEAPQQRATVASRLSFSRWLKVDQRRLQ